MEHTLLRLLQGPKGDESSLFWTSSKEPEEAPESLELTTASDFGDVLLSAQVLARSHLIPGLGSQKKAPQSLNLVKNLQKIALHFT